jgi:hypothetical protein
MARTGRTYPSHPVLPTWQAAPLATLTDTFSGASVDTGKWTTYGTVTESGGTLAVLATTAYSGVIAQRPWVLTGSSMLAQVTPPPAGTNNSFQTGVEIDIAQGSNSQGGAAWEFVATSGTRQIQPVYWDTGGTSHLQTAITLPASTLWVRIRESAGTLYWDYSTDAVNWTNQFSIADPFPTGAMFPQLWAGYYAAETDTNATFDNFNVPPVAQPLNATAGAASQAAANVIIPTTAYRDLILSEAGLISYWRLDETSGQFQDSKGTNPSTTVGSSIAYNAGGLITNSADAAASNAPAFGSTTSYINIPTSASLDVTTALTVEAWVKPSGIPASGSPQVISRGSDQLWYIRHYQTGDGRWEFNVFDSAAARITTAVNSPVAQVGVTQHIVMTYDPATVLKCYINGVQVGTAAATANSIATNGALCIFDRNPGSGSNFQGSIDEVAVYGVVLSAAQVATHYGIGTGQPYMAPVARAASQATATVTAPTAIPIAPVAGAASQALAATTAAAKLTASAGTASAATATVFAATRLTPTAGAASQATATVTAPTAQLLTPTASAATQALAPLTAPVWLQPGGAAGGNVQVASDDFNRADGAVGGGWVTGFDAAPVIVSQQIKGVTSATWHEILRGETYGNDQWSQIQVETPPGLSDWIGTCVRADLATGQNLYRFIYFNNGGSYELRIGKRVSGTGSTLATTVLGATPLPAGTTLMLSVVGSTLSLYQNGALALTTTDTQFPSGGAPGIIIFSNTATGDNWSGGNVVAATAAQAASAATATVTTITAQALAPTAGATAQATTVLSAPSLLTPTAATASQATVVLRAATALSASAGATTSATVAVTAAVKLALTAGATSAASVSLTTASVLAPSAQAATQALATVSVGGIPLTAVANAVTQATVTLTASSLLTATAVAITQATAFVTAPQPLTATARASSALTVVVTGAVTLSLSAQATTSAHGFTTAAVLLGGAPTANYRATVLSDAPTGYWRLDDTTTTAVDSSGSGDPGTYTGGYTQSQPGLLPSDPDKATTFDGTSGYVDCGNPSAFQLTTGSVEGWFKLASPPPSGQLQAVIVKQYGFGIFVNPNGYIDAFDWTGFAFFNSGGGGYGTNGPNLNDGNAHHVVLTFRSGVANGCVMYVDGAAVTTLGDTTLTVSDQSHDLMVGWGGTGTTQFFDGVLDEAAIYNYVLTPTQVLAHYSAGTVAGVGGVAAYAATSALATMSVGGVPLTAVANAATQATVALTAPSLLIANTAARTQATGLVAAQQPLTATALASSALTVAVVTGAASIIVQAGAATQAVATVTIPVVAQPLTVSATAKTKATCHVFPVLGPISGFRDAFNDLSQWSFSGDGATPIGNGQVQLNSGGTSGEWMQTLNWYRLTNSAVYLRFTPGDSNNPPWSYFQIQTWDANSVGFEFYDQSAAAGGPKAGGDWWCASFSSPGGSGNGIPSSAFAADRSIWLRVRESGDGYLHMEYSPDAVAWTEAAGSPLAWAPYVKGLDIVGLYVQTDPGNAAPVVVPYAVVQSINAAPVAVTATAGAATQASATITIPVAAQALALTAQAATAATGVLNAPTLLVPTAQATSQAQATVIPARPIAPTAAASTQALATVVVTVQLSLTATAASQATSGMQVPGVAFLTLSAAASTQALAPLTAATALIVTAQAATQAQAPLSAATKLAAAAGAVTQATAQLQAPMRLSAAASAAAQATATVIPAVQLAPSAAATTQATMAVGVANVVSIAPVAGASSQALAATRAASLLNLSATASSQALAAVILGSILSPRAAAATQAQAALTAPVQFAAHAQAQTQAVSLTTAPVALTADALAQTQAVMFATAGAVPLLARAGATAAATATVAVRVRMVLSASAQTSAAASVLTAAFLAPAASAASRASATVEVPTVVALVPVAQAATQARMTVAGQTSIFATATAATRATLILVAPLLTTLQPPLSASVVASVTSAAVVDLRMYTTVLLSRYSASVEDLEVVAQPTIDTGMLAGVES